MAKLSPSFARVWLHCPKAATASEAVPFVTNEYVISGTNIHLRAAYEISKAFDIPQLDIEYHCDEDDLAIVNDYVRFCKQIVKDVFGNSAINVYVEQKISVADFVYDGNGIIDFMAFNNHTVFITDLKTGYDMVYAKGNEQLLFYALASRAYIKANYGYDINNFYLAISQPRRDNHYVVYINAEGLDKWLADNKTNIDLAYHNKGDYVVGSHCEYCYARGACKHYILDTLEGKK